MSDELTALADNLERIGSSSFFTETRKVLSDAASALRSYTAPHKPQPAPGWDEATAYAERIAVSLHKKHYRGDAPRAALDQAIASLDEIAESHIPDCPSHYGGNELAWAQRHVAHLRRKAEIVRDGIKATLALTETSITIARNPNHSNTSVEAKNALYWAVGRWNAEVLNRPLQNIHRRSLDDTWRQVIRHFGGDDRELCGPTLTRSGGGR